MKYSSHTLALPLFFTFFLLSSCDILNQVMQQTPVLSKAEIAEGLKEALRVGTDTAVSRLAKRNGFYENPQHAISLPPEADIIVKNIGRIPLVGDAVLEETKKLINRSAENAVRSASPIFVDAIRNMSITDALGILNGSDSAATSYLRETTYKKLFNSFKPKIEASLNKKLVGNISAESSYDKLITNYNKVANLPLSGLDAVKENSLSNFVTRKALRSLFIRVAEEESDIRHDASARVNEKLKKVFGELDKGNVIAPF